MEGKERTGERGCGDDEGTKGKGRKEKGMRKSLEK